LDESLEMEIKELQNFAKEENERGRSKTKTSEKESILTTAIKLGEEVGEVSEEVLKHFNYQVKDKSFEKNEISYEIADVIIVASILADSLGIDLEESLKEKMKKIKERYEK